MKYLHTFAIFVLSIYLSAQTAVTDDFEGNGTISTWFGDGCNINQSLANPFQMGINPSATVLAYHDLGGQFANLRFDVPANFDLSTQNTFTFKIHVPSSGITGSQTNQVSLKLQDGTLGAPWTTQTEIIKPIVLDQWQEVSFDFANDTYSNLDAGSLPPIQRTDFNRVLIQINGEDNNDHVLAYIDDFQYDGTVGEASTFTDLVWADEFDVDGAVDATKWHHQTQLIAGDSWANNEQQHYTNRTDNSYVDNGTLKIVAKGEVFTDQGVTKNYTSARLNAKFAFQYGRVEVRAKLPSIAGTWPAIWLLGKNINEDGGYWDNQGFGTTPWPFCGEIDIMEPNIAKTEILATWHWANSSMGYTSNSGSISTTNADTSQNFHIYALEWDENAMRIYMDGFLINSQASIDPFNQEFYILLNVAMGGNLGGTIQPGFTQDAMEIDYIRIYQQEALQVNDPQKTELLGFYPNPVMNHLVIQTPDIEKPIEIQIYNLEGKVVRSYLKTAMNGEVSLDDLSGLSAGTYLLRYQSSEEAGSLKFLKK